jgi:WD40 repeat protein
MSTHLPKKTSPSHGGVRGADFNRRSSQFEGRFGRIFRSLPAATWSENALRKLAGDGQADNSMSAVNSANFSPDGSKIVTGSWDKTARVWGRIDSLDTNLNSLLTRSCNKLHDYLSTNPNVKPEDRDLCGIKKVEQQ